jgi:hypothetical protein
MFVSSKETYMLIAKVGDKLVQVIRVADKVGFSEERGWVLAVFDFEKPKFRQLNIKWLPMSTRFEWVRDFRFI